MLPVHDSSALWCRRGRITRRYCLLDLNTRKVENEHFLIGKLEDNVQIFGKDALFFLFFFQTEEG